MAVLLVMLCLAGCKTFKTMIPGADDADLNKQRNDESRWKEFE